MNCAFAAVGAGVGASIKAAADFEQGIADAQAMMALTGEEAVQLGQPVGQRGRAGLQDPAFAWLNGEGSCTSAKHPPHPQQALHAQDQRQGRALRADALAKAGGEQPVETQQPVHRRDCAAAC